MVHALVCAALLAARIDGDGPTLSLGDQAPAITVEHWVRGAPVPTFAKGNLYVVEFWATWCPPCVRSIPQLTKIQSDYRDQKLTVIGVAANEAPEDDQEKLDLVKAFVAEKRDEMAYTVAVDTDRSMGRTWMQAAGQQGIPTAFIVDRDGRIAWIGQPSEMDEPLARIVAGTYDVAAAAEKVRRRAELERKALPLRLAFEEAAQHEKWDDAIRVLDEVIALDGVEFGPLRLKKLEIMLTHADETRAYAYATEILPKLEGDVELLNGLAWLIVDPHARVKTRNLDLALKAANRANELAQEKNASVLDTLARIHATSGDYAKAVELETRAMALLDAPRRAALEPTLKEYAAKAKKD